MLKRKIYEELLEWKGRPHKPLVISGQRQVGKTFIIREFAANEYGGCFEMDLAKDEEARKVFDDGISVDSILKRISVVYPGAVLEPGRTLIFIDEIQESKAAYASLKYFKDDGRFDVIASGSMLGVKMPNLKDSPDEPGYLTPLGYEECKHMFALDFEEFLWAKGVPEDAIADIRGHIAGRERIDDVILQKMNSYFREFMIVGGMPESVSEFVRTGQFTGVRRVLSDLNAGCLRDINRYNNGIDVVKTTECYESIPDQLAEMNKKFMYSRINGGGSRKAADRYYENLLWLKGAGYGNFCYGALNMALPLRSKRDLFKVYLSDTGMLVNRYGENCIKAVYSGRYDYNLGAIAENAVAECLTKSGYLPRFFQIKKGGDKMELDFVVETGDGLCVVEVKSGKDRSAASMRKACEKYEVARRIMLSEENIGVDDEGTENYPLFAAAFFRMFEPVWDGPAI